MKKIRHVSVFVLFLVLAFGASTAFAATAPDLGTAANFATLGGTAVTLTDSTVTGNVGSAAVGTVTKTNSTVNGTAYLSGGETAVLGAHSDFLSAYGTVASATVATTMTGTLAGITLTPGVYSFDTSGKTGTLTLDAQGDPNAVWIFKSAVATGYLAATNFNVIFLNGVGKASNVFWWTGAYAAVTDSNFRGTILSGDYVTVTRGSFTGRALATSYVTVTTSSTFTVPTTPCTGIVGTSVFVSTSGSDSNNDGSEACPFATIQTAVNDAATLSGDTINVAAGTYTEIGQIVINKNLSIVGADKVTTIIKPNASTTDAYYNDTSAWILVNPGVTFNLSKVTLDGAGKGITNAILSHGLGTIDGNIIKNIAYNQSGPDYSGAGIALYTATTTVSNNDFSGIGREGVFVAFQSTATITGNTYTGKGAGNWLDYAVEVGHNSTATISDNTVSGNTGVAASDGSTSAGIVISSFHDTEVPDGTTSGATITNNTITGNTRGIEVGIYAADTSLVVAHNNDLSINSTDGVMSTSTARTVDVTHNWWGNASGPNDLISGDGSTPETNAGTGSAAVGAVNYSPWCANATCTTLETAEPVITLNGDTPNIGLGSTYSELGATTIDIIDGSVAVVISGSVNTAVVGSYTITYTATDTDGNTATATRTVNVVRTNNGEGGGGGGSVGGGAAASGFFTMGTNGQLLLISSSNPQPVVTPVVIPTQGQVLGASAFSFNNGLAIGSRGDDVTELQNRLTAEGVYTGPITGYFGSLTAQGVKNFQKKYGISQVGSVGPQTRAKLNSILVSTVPGCLAGNSFSITTGQSCLVNTSSILGCFAGNNFSITSGQSCSVRVSSVPGCVGSNNFSITTGRACFTQ